MTVRFVGPCILASPGWTGSRQRPSLSPSTPRPTHQPPRCSTACSDERRALARQTLHSLQPRVAELLGGQPLRVQLRGLEYMNDDLSQVRIGRGSARTGG